MGRPSAFFFVISLILRGIYDRDARRFHPPQIIVTQFQRGRGLSFGIFPIFGLCFAFM